MDIIAIPRDPVPYQESLYEPLRRRGVRVRYAAELTPSRSLNLLLLPFELVALRLLGYRVLHLHWTFGFGLPFSERVPPMRRLARLWFGLVLLVAKIAGLRLAWTAHNVLPHAPVFDDDVAARRTLLRHADLVILHAENVSEALRQHGLNPRATRVIPHGPLVPHQLLQLGPPSPGSTRSIVFFGRIEPYKGVEELLQAVRSAEAPLRVVVAGACASDALRERLIAAASGLENVTLMLGRVPDEALLELLDPADALAFPFRSVTTSASVSLALAAARPVIVPDLAALSVLPDSVTIRYPPGREGLTAALTRVATMPAAQLTAMGVAGREFALSNSWEDAALSTKAAFEDLVAPARSGS